MVRDRERQSRDDYIREGLARDVDAHPETVRPKKNAAWRGPKLLEQFPARRPLPLDQEIHVVLLEERFHLGRELLHHAVAREENKSATFRFRDEVPDPMRQGFGVSGITRVRHLADDEEFHLLREIERTPELERIHFGGANPGAEVG